MYCSTHGYNAICMFLISSTLAFCEILNVCPWLSSLTSDQNQTKQFTLQKGCQRTAATVSKAVEREKINFLPKLTKPKLAKQKEKKEKGVHPVP